MKRARCGVDTGSGIQVLGLWRLMAYNWCPRLRCRYLRTREHTRAEKRRWQEWCDALFLLICHVGRDLFPTGRRLLASERARWSAVVAEAKGLFDKTLLPPNRADGPLPRHAGERVRGIRQRIIEKSPGSSRVPRPR